ncbi:MAG: hypothetical protein ACYDCH_08275 [Gaiellaceae bacterium]
MRRPAVLAAFVFALALPGVSLAWGGRDGIHDGTLVVRNAQGTVNGPVVALNITGAALGYVGGGRIVIDPGPNGATPEVTGADWRRDFATSDTAQVWGGTTFKFRAVGGHFTILIYGHDIDVVAIGTGTVTLAGQPDTPNGDGTYSVNGSDFHSLPPAPTQRTIGTTAIG